MYASLESLLLAFNTQDHANLISNRIPALARRSRRRRLKRINGIYRVVRSIKASNMRLREESRRPVGRLEKNVQALRRLMPPREPMGLTGLFNEAADYVACLQAQVKVMQMIIKVLLENSD